MPNYTEYNATPANNNSAPPVGAPEGMPPSAVNDIQRYQMAVIRDLGDRHAALSGLGADGARRTVWASVFFQGNGTLLNSFNSMSVIRNSAGYYSFGMPDIGTTRYAVIINYDSDDTINPISAFVLNGTRSTTSFQIKVKSGTGAGHDMNPVDLVFVSVEVVRIG